MTLAKFSFGIFLSYLFDFFFFGFQLGGIWGIRIRKIKFQRNRNVGVFLLAFMAMIKSYYVFRYWKKC